MFFAADGGTRGRGLWTSDGTAAGTVLVKGLAGDEYGGLSDAPAVADRCS